MLETDEPPPISPDRLKKHIRNIHNGFTSEYRQGVPNCFGGCSFKAYEDISPRKSAYRDREQAGWEGSIKNARSIEGSAALYKPEGSASRKKKGGISYVWELATKIPKKKGKKPKRLPDLTDGALVFT